MNRALDRDRPSSSQVWLDVVSAVDYLSKGHRPDLTVYDAMEEALRWHINALVAGHGELVDAVQDRDLPWNDPDALRTALEQLTQQHHSPDDEQSTSAIMIHTALVFWVQHMADLYNDGGRWASPRGGWRGAD